MGSIKLNDICGHAGGSNVSWLWESRLPCILLLRYAHWNLSYDLRVFYLAYVYNCGDYDNTSAG